MKAYTDIEQSKKLAEILPMESADMHYARVNYYDEIRDWNIYLSPVPEICASYIENLPCWSLAALLDILPTLEGRNPVFCKDIHYDKWHIVYTSTAELSKVDTERYDNLVDACYEMITKLHKLNLL